MGMKIFPTEYKTDASIKIKRLGFFLSGGTPQLLFSKKLTIGCNGIYGKNGNAGLAARIQEI